jgi:hypothetical protein
MQKQISTLVLLAILAPWVVFPAPVSAQTGEVSFSMNRLVSDDDFTDTVTMSAERIQHFLDNQAGVLKRETFVVGTETFTAAQVIYNAAKANNISPKVLLVTIQKESSMITRSNFNTSGYSGSKQYYLDWVVFYGWCDSCSTGVNKGFVNQMNSAAAAFRRYLDNIADPARGYTVSGWGPNITKSLVCISSDAAPPRNLCKAGSTIQITPVNAATAALYTYTPHPGGNFAFWYIWNQFGFGTHRLYPDGSLLRAKGGSRVYLIEKGEKRPFVTVGAFVSRYSFSKVITVNSDQLDLYDNGPSIAYANYSLLQPPGPGVYLLVDNTVRPISSGAAFKAAGFSRDEVVKVSWADIGQFSVGEKITTENIFPSGQLFQSKKTGTIYFVKDGLRYGVPSRDILKNQFKNRKAIPIASEALQKYPMNGVVVFKDGELITNKKGGTAYFMSNGQKLPIASWDVAVAYHFDKIWKNIIKTDQVSLDAIPTGPTLDIDGVVQTTAKK